MAGRKLGQKTRRQSFSCLNLKTLLSTNNRNIYQIFIYLMSLNSGKCTRKWRGSKYQCEYLGSSEPMFWWTWIFHKLNLLLQIAFGHVWVATLHTLRSTGKKTHKALWDLVSALPYIAKHSAFGWLLLSISGLFLFTSPTSGPPHRLSSTWNVPSSHILINPLKPFDISSDTVSIQKPFLNLQAGHVRSAQLYMVMESLSSI